MKHYENKYMSEAMVTEIENLINGGHGAAIEAFAKEIQNATLEGFGDGIANECIKGFMKGTFIGAAAALGAYIVTDQVLIAYRKWKEKKAVNVEDTERVLEA